LKAIHFIKEPGYTYDLLSLFASCFAKLQESDFAGDKESAVKDLAHYDYLISLLGPVSDELLPFFYRKDKHLCFMIQCYFQPFNNDYLSSYSVSSVINALRKCDEVVENMLQYYFGNADQAALEESKHSCISAGRLIKASPYPAEVKSALYSFFLEPETVIQKLCCELKEKECVLADYYNARLNEIQQLQSQFEIDTVLSGLSSCGSGMEDFSKFETAYVSFCSCAYRTVRVTFHGDRVLFMLGTKYEETLSLIDLKKRLPTLDSFGTIISEKNRIDILNLILRKGELGIFDIEQALGISGTNAYYHLSMMNKANMLKTRNRGRTVLYSLNTEYFRAVCKQIAAYAQLENNPG